MEVHFFIIRLSTSVANNFYFIFHVFHKNFISYWHKVEYFSFRKQSQHCSQFSDIWGHNISLKKPFFPQNEIHKSNRFEKKKK